MSKSIIESLRASTKEFNSHLNENAATKGAAAGGNLSQVPPLEKGEI